MRHCLVLALGLVSVILVVLVSSIASSYVREGNSTYVHAEVMNEVMALNPNEVIIAVVYSINAIEWGVEIQKVGELYKSEDEALTACTTAANNMGNKSRKSFTRTYRYTYDDARKIREDRAAAEAAHRRAQEEQAEKERKAATYDVEMRGQRVFQRLERLRYGR